ncbi:hypothetical protein D3Z47_17230 [Lachnospiraceae bacterium]|nr:hypothetical protein [Lachnospiraceae bacterium]
MKKYEEFDMARMEADYELNMRYERYYNEREDDEENNKIYIDYINEENFISYQNEVKVELEGSLIKKKKNYYPLDVISASCDYVCKLMIYSYAQSVPKISPANLYVGNKNCEYKLITSGNYTRWKGKFMESDFADFFGIRKKVYVIKGLEELLNYSAICILLLNEYLSDDINIKDVEEETWIVAQRILQEYDNGKQKITVSREEKNTICYLVFEKTLYKSELDYLRSRRCQIEKSTCIKIEDKQKIRKHLAEIGQKLNREYDCGEKIKMEHGYDDARQIKFAPYLSPIIAAMCDYYSEHDAEKVKNLWVKEKTLKKINESWFGKENVENEEKLIQLSQDFSLLKKYMDYREKYKGMYTQESFLEKYYYFFYLINYKIGCKKNKAVDKRYRFIQFYVLEDLLKWKLIKKETEVIYECLQESNTIIDMHDMMKPHYRLKLILRKLSNVGNVLERIELAERVIKDYFEFYGQWQNGKDEKEIHKWRRDVIRKIEHHELVFDTYERLFLDEVFYDKKEDDGKDEEIWRGKLKDREILFCNDKQKKTYDEQISSSFQEEINLSEYLWNEKESNINKISDLRKHAKKEIEKLKSEKKIIEKWVILCNFSSVSEPDIQLEV